jgi:hypothetical protein
MLVSWPSGAAGSVMGLMSRNINGMNPIRCNIAQRDPTAVRAGHTDVRGGRPRH